MFKYGLNGQQSQPGEKQRKLVTKYREVTYVRFCKSKKKLVESHGQEIVEEMTVPPDVETLNAVCVGHKIIDNSEKDFKEFKKKERYFSRGNKDENS